MQVIVAFKATRLEQQRIYTQGFPVFFATIEHRLLSIKFSLLLWFLIILDL